MTGMQPPDNYGYTGTAGPEQPYTGPPLMGSGPGHSGMGHPPEKQKHSGFGIVSFILSIVMGIVLFSILFILAGPIWKHFGEMLLLLFLLGALGVEFIAMVFGIVGIVQGSRKKVFAILGTVISAFIFIGFVMLIMIGP